MAGKSKNLTTSRRSRRRLLRSDPGAPASIDREISRLA